MKLTTNPDNPRTITTDAYNKLKRSIQRNPDGLTANKIAHKDGVIISGNQRYRAILELKLDTQHGGKGFKWWKQNGATPLTGYMLRYIYFIDKTCRAKLTCPEIPYSQIKTIGATMYLGQHNNHACEALTIDAPSIPDD